MVFMNALTKALKAGFEEYSGKSITDIEVHADPQVERCYAARVTLVDGVKVDFIVYADNLEHSLVAVSASRVADLIEECRFKSWPPRSGALRF